MFTVDVDTRRKIKQGREMDEVGKRSLFFKRLSQRPN